MLQSFKKNKIGIGLMLLSALFACLGQMFWKLSATKGIWFLLIGFVFYAVGALIMLIAYRHGSLSVLQPMLSVNYIITLILAHFVLHETITPARIIGIAVIMVGVFLIGGGDE